MNTDFKVGGNSIKFATSAEMVKYGSSNVKDVLDNLNFDTTEMSDFGRQLYEAQDEKEFKELLGISSEPVWDECQNRWQGEAYLSTAQAKFGTKSLYTAGVTLQTAAPITFGGDPFTISFYAYATSLTAGNAIFRALGTTRSFGTVMHNSGSVNGMGFYYGTTSASNAYQFKDNGSYYMVVPATKAWQLYTLTYNGAGTISFKLGGTTKNVTIQIPREPRRLIFGAFAGYVDEFELIDNGTTKSLLHFE